MNKHRLSKNVIPKRYELSLDVDLDNFSYSGNEIIFIDIKKSTTKIQLNAAELTIDKCFIQNKDKNKLFESMMSGVPILSGGMEYEAKFVNDKYINNSISAGFACIYIPSESLYHEITTHINEKKVLWISTVQEKTGATLRS